MSHIKNALLVPLVIGCMMACSRTPTPVKRSSLSLRSSLQAQENTLRLLDRMGEQSAQATKEGRVAASANADIQRYVSTERATVEEQRKSLQKAIADVDEFAGGRTKKTEREVIDAANAAVLKSGETLRILDKKTEVIVDFLGNETYSKSEIRTLFQPGDFTLNASEMQEGQQRFRPIVEKLYTFAGKYRDGLRQLRGEIIITGYADATPVEPGSKLYQDLSLRLGQDDGITAPTSSDLNKKLSELRAGTIKVLLESILRARKSTTGKPMNVKITVLGRGEEIPNGSDGKPMAANDPNRRLATFYWVVLPDL